MNKKGFVFVETIIVIGVLMTVLLMLFSSFISILSQEKRATTFDDVTYLYRTFYIEDFLVSLNLDKYINVHLETPNSLNIKPLITVIDCHDNLLYNLRNENNIEDVNERNKKEYCEAIIDGGRMEIEHIYITRYNLKELVDCTNNDNSVTCNTNEELRNLSANAISYLRSLSGDSPNDYRLIIEYKTKLNNKDHYFYSNVKIVKRDLNG